MYLSVVTICFQKKKLSKSAQRKIGSRYGQHMQAPKKKNKKSYNAATIT